MRRVQQHRGVPLLLIAGAPAAEAEQRARIFRRARQEYGSNYGGGSRNQTPEALERFAADAALELVASEAIPDALVLDTVGVGVPELAKRVLSATGWPDRTWVDFDCH